MISAALYVFNYSFMFFRIPLSFLYMLSLFLGFLWVFEVLVFGFVCFLFLF